MNDINYPVIMIHGGDITVLGIARSLGVENIPVKLITWFKYLPGNYSRYVEPVIFPDPNENKEEFVQLLISYGESMCKEYGRRLLLLPSADDALLLISDYYYELVKYFVILGDSTEKEGIEHFIRKDNFFEMVKKIDLPSPLTIPCLSEGDIDYAVKNVPYPCIVKPIIKDLNFSFYNRYDAKAIEFNSPELLSASLSQLIKEGYEVLVQEKIPGNYGVNTLDFYSNREGNIKAAFASFQARQDRPQYGTCTVMESKWVPDMFEYGKKIIKNLKYWGMGTLEWKLDPRDDKYKFIELNVRPVLSIYKVTGGGVNIPLVAYKDVYEKEDQKGVMVPSPEIDGFRWINLYEDFKVVMKSDNNIRTRLKLLISNFQGKSVYAVFSLKDPLPSIVHMILLIYKRGL